MDSLTQATLGAAVGEFLLGRKLGNRAPAWGALLGTLPDLDVVFSPLLDNSGNLWWHRGPSHSLLIMLVGSWLLSGCLAKRWKKDSVTRLHVGGFVAAVWATHVLIDCFTVYGTSVLWPFSDQRVAFNNLFIIDPFYTLPMLLPLLVALFLRGKNQQILRRRLNSWGLVVSSAYVALSLVLKWMISSQFDADLARRDVRYDRRMEAPTPFNILLWRSVVDRGDELWVGYRSVFDDRDASIRWTVFPKGQSELSGLDNLREVRRVQWFSDSWWIARSHAKGVWIGDLRFGEGRQWDRREGMLDVSPAFAWDVIPTADRDRLQPYYPGREDVAESLKRLAKRITGDASEWESTPRLTGVTGRLPELLIVDD